MAAQIARKLARFHYQDVPVGKLPTSLLDITEQYVDAHDPDEFKRFLAASGCDDYRQRLDIRDEIAWAREVESKISTRLVLGHGDTNLGNILVRDSPDGFGERVALVDIEGACCTSRGRDIGGFFMCLMLDKHGPQFTFADRYPNSKWRRLFLQAYLDQVKEVNNGLDDAIDNVQQLELESDFHTLITPLYWTSILMDQKRDGYLTSDLKIAQSMIRSNELNCNTHNLRKQQFLAKYGKNLGIL